MPRANSSVPRHRRHRKIVKLAKGIGELGIQTLRLRKMRLKKAYCMHIEIEGRKKECLESFGL